MFDLTTIIFTILGLVAFEVISSFDNAVINAEVLRKMSPWARRWFLIWGLLLAVFLIRGALPWLLVYISNPALGPWGAFTATFSNDPAVVEAMEASAPLVLMAGGIFLLFLFLHWLFLEEKSYGLHGEKFFHSQGAWFFAVVAIVLTAIVWLALTEHARTPFLAFSAVVGSTAFFIIHGFRQNAEMEEKKLLGESANTRSDWSKILYLEAIDASFSIDGVVGAFAFTMSVPLILIGNGLGAFVVRELTIRNIDNVKKYVFLKNGAMYSVLVLGAIMVSEAFGAHIPPWFAPASTFAIIGFFLWKSVRLLKKIEFQKTL
ncbi:MAG: DUF475 domain-containing protein [Candidatus Micrarchaeia archaeon]